MSSRDCPFCKPDQLLKDRVFYDTGRWFAFLAAPYHTKGHAIVAAKRSNARCPRGLGREILGGLDLALANVARALRKHYRPKDILLASVRGHYPHTHCHLIPLRLKEERKWRRQHLYEDGHLLEFLGALEKEGDSNAVIERIDRGWSAEDQRAHIVRRLKSDILGLRHITTYNTV